MRYLATATTVVVASVALSACGGGGGVSSPGVGTPVPMQPGQGVPVLTPADPGATLAVLQKAATSVPRLDRRSVTQSSNTDNNNVTQDTAEAVFDRGEMTVSVVASDPASFVLNSKTDAHESVVGSAVRNDQIARRWQLQKEFEDRTTVVHSFGEKPTEEFPLRAVHAGGNWWTNQMPVVSDWEAGNRSGPLVPPDHIAFLKRTNVNWVGLSVALHYDDSMDSTVERVYSDDVEIPTFPDEALRQFIREFKDQGIDVYLTLAFESMEAENAERPVRRWQLGDPGVAETGVPPEDPEIFGRIAPEDWPWRPDHPDHQPFVAEFWETYTEQAVHFARIAETEGVRMFSLGTEVDRLFRTRSGGRWPNHFSQELTTMVERVRQVYSGLLTYDMHYDAIVSSDFFGPGSNHLWQDLNLDVVGISAWFPLVDAQPSQVSSVQRLEARYEEVFRQYLIPLAENNPDRPIAFLEYGAVDSVGTPANPGAVDFQPLEFSDADGNGIDDGQETQANMFQALLNTMAKYPGVLDGIFWWGNLISSDEDWAAGPGGVRDHSFRGRLSEEVVRSTYETWGDWLTGGHWMHLDADMNVVGAGAFVDGPELARSSPLPNAGTATYEGSATGGYATEYGTDHPGIVAGSHTIGQYEGEARLTADFQTGLISGRVHSIGAGGFHTPSGGGVVQRIAARATNYEVVLAATAFNHEGFTGETTAVSTDPRIGIASSSGSWGGRFSNVSDGDGNPRLVAGTHGANFVTTGGSRTSLIGVFVGTSRR